MVFDQSPFRVGEITRIAHEAQFSEKVRASLTLPDFLLPDSFLRGRDGADEAIAGGAWEQIGRYSKHGLRVSTRGEVRGNSAFHERFI
jgi:hypothetical protein